MLIYQGFWVHINQCMQEGTPTQHSPVDKLPVCQRGPVPHGPDRGRHPGGCCPEPAAQDAHQESPAARAGKGQQCWHRGDGRLRQRFGGWWDPFAPCSIRTNPHITIIIAHTHNYVSGLNAATPADLSSILSLDTVESSDSDNSNRGQGQRQQGSKQEIPADRRNGRSGVGGGGPVAMPEGTREVHSCSFSKCF